MNTAIGFTTIWNAAEPGGAQAPARAVFAPASQGADAALHRALAHFPELESVSVQIGETALTLWGRKGFENGMHRMADGSLLALIGSPLGEFPLPIVEEHMRALNQIEDFRLPWEGRTLLLHISADGRRWTLWNDWLGSLPVFYSTSPQMRIASTLEPAVVAAGAYTEADIFLPGLLFMLMHGNFFADWTLYKQMKTIRPDCVTTLDAHGAIAQGCCTVEASDARWEAGWDDMVDEMHALVQDAVQNTLKTQPSWILPLSSGLDSRLIAAIGAQDGRTLNAFTWGPPDTRDTIYSQRIAKTLGLPWQRIDLGEDYLEQYLPLWSSLFGSAMHFHGMYQMPFLEALRAYPEGKIVSGFIGECLAGYDVRFQAKHFQTPDSKYYTHPTGYVIWKIQELKSLFKFPIDDALEQIACQLVEEKSRKSGPEFQRIRFLTLWGRQNHFTYFQSMLSDAWRGVATPYLNRAYARFALSLPRAVLDDRRLQIEMMRRYYPKIMDIGGTYANEPAVLSGTYLLSRRLAKRLPRALIARLLPEFTAEKNIKTDITSLQHSQKKAIWPIPETGPALANWLNMGEVEKAYQTALGGSIHAVRQLQSIQAFAYRLRAE